MRLSRFLTELFELGHVRLEQGLVDADTADRQAASRILAERERVVAADFPSPVPAVDTKAAAWAAWQFYAACQFVLYREAPMEDVRAKLDVPPPPGEAAAQHYSVDLVWRFLPDLDRLTATLAPHDPLREIVHRWGADWPLSSVGMTQVEPRRVEDLLSHPGLRQAYVDRIIQQRDSSRLQLPPVRDFVQAALGRDRVNNLAWCKSLPVAAAPTNPPEPLAVQGTDHP